ncbi:MAG: glycosyltransferase family 2 protein [bacterium]|nr:glycosyltransferase family 2 protein [bacterium]
MKNPYLSVVIPFYNEQGSLEKLTRELFAVLKKMNKSFEIIFVDDGSTDRSLEIVKNLNKEIKEIEILHFSRNQGKSSVLQAGFDRARGEYVVTMDADLQDDPKEIPNLLKALVNKYDLISGWKKDRHDPWHKTIPSFFFNGMIRRFSGVGLHDINCGLKIYKNEVVKSLSIYGELYRFIPVLAAHKGFKVGEIVVKHRPRQFGQSKYGISRFLRGFLDLLTVIFLTKFLKRPLHFFGPLGILMLVAGIAILGYLTYLHFALSQSIGDRPLLIFGMIFVIAGLQLIFTGLLAELVTYYAQTANKLNQEDK